MDLGGLMDCLFRPLLYDLFKRGHRAGVPERGCGAHEESRVVRPHQRAAVDGKCTILFSNVLLGYQSHYQGKDGETKTEKGDKAASKGG